MTNLEKEIINIVDATRGIKYQMLEANMLCARLELDKSEIHNIIEGLIIDGKIAEIQYEIPGFGIYSYIVPKGSVLRP